MLRDLLPYYKPYRTRLALVLAGAVFTSLVELFFPLCIRYIMDQVLPKKDLLLLAQLSLGLLAGYIFNLAINYRVSVEGRLVGALMERDLRQKLFEHVSRFSFKYFDNHQVGQLLSRIVGDIAEIRELVSLGPNFLLVCTIFMVGTAVILFSLNWQLALLINAFLIAKAWDSFVTNRKLKEMGRATRGAVGNISGCVAESLSAVRLAQAFTNEDLEAQRLAKEAEILLAYRKKNFQLLAHSHVSMVFFTNVINLAIICAGGVLIYTSGMKMSDLVAFLLYVAIFVRPVLRLNALAEVYQKGVAGFARYQELLKEQGGIPEAEDAFDTGPLCGNIVFEDVTFGYREDRQVLKHFSLAVKAGEAVAFVGSTGVGKSTLCNLLPRFYELQGGRITIDGIDIKKMTLTGLRRNIGSVAQDIFLFADTVYNNIAYGRPGATREEVEQAAILAEADRFIKLLPHGYDSELGERGVKLSGGQKQRLAIARAFLKDPPILILDEATSSLDNETEQAIQNSLAALSKDRTTLIIAHRLATIKNADRIVVLKDGGIAEQGTHHELLAAKGEYYRLYMAQFKED